MKKDEILKIIAEVKEEVAQDYKAEIKGIFGSYARGDKHEESDIDVLVDFGEGAGLFDLVGLGLFLEEKLHCKVDVVPQRSLREEIRPNVMREMVHIPPVKPAIRQILDELEG